MKIQVIQPEAISLSMTPLMNPTKEPKPAYMASPDCFPEVSSPMTAPAKGPMISPNGGKMKSPATSPMTLPQTPRRLAPNFLAPHTGTI